MKPVKNHVFCPACGRAKILFKTEKKAMNFIKWNGEEIMDENGKAPVRAYYCSLCGGWHVTSVEKVVENYKSRLEVLIERYICGQKRKQKNKVRIPVDTRSPIPVISVQSVGDLQYRRQS